MTKKESSKRRLKIIGSTLSEPSPAAEVIVGNVDLLTEILLRVPAKSLVRFKSVSKNWLLLISDSHFAFNHARRNHSSSISGLYFYHNYWSRKEQVNSVSLHDHPSLPTLAFLDGVGGECATIRIKSSCNGLLLCENDRTVCNCNTTSYIVCNLTTQKYKVLPEHGGRWSKSYPAYLAFDPSKSPHYKVFLFSYIHRSYQFDIFSSESASWKHITVNVLPVKSLNGVYWNGAIHWLSDEDVHFRFDVGAEELIRMPNPPAPKILPVDKIRYFGECDGHLILIQMRLRYAMGFRILEMDRDSCHWSVKCRVNLRTLLSVFPEIDDRSKSYNFHVLRVVKGVNEDDFALVLAAAGRVIYYNLKCKTLKVLRDGNFNFQSSIYDPYPYARTYQFIESLSPV